VQTIYRTGLNGTSYWYRLGIPKSNQSIWRRHPHLLGDVGQAERPLWPGHGPDGECR